MSLSLKRMAGSMLALTRLDRLPVRVRSGIARGARWTLYPSTAYWRGTHEPEVQAVLMGLGDGDIRGWCCWDIGAHFGLYSIGLARRVGPTGQVAAFEPNPLSYARLQRHVAMNDLPWLKTFAVAASDQPGPAEFYTYGDLNTTTTHLPYDDEPRTAAARAISVECQSLDTLVRAGELRPPHFIKLDVEGHGHRAMAGMAATLAQHRPIVLAALHSTPEADGIFARLGGLGYTHAAVGLSSLPDSAPGHDYLFTPPQG
jgi:FkbM family methyltransferase